MRVFDGKLSLVFLGLLLWSLTLLPGVARAFPIADQQQQPSISFVQDGVTLTFSATADDVTAAGGAIGEENFLAGRLRVTFSSPVTLSEIGYHNFFGNDLDVEAFDAGGTLITSLTNVPASANFDPSFGPETNMSDTQNLSNFVNVSRLEFFNSGLEGVENDVLIAALSFTTASGAPEIAVSEATGGAIADGGTLAQGTKAAGTAQTLTFTVSNSGTDTLTLATATSANASNVSVGSISAPGSTSVAAGGSTTFTVQYTPTAAGAFSFDLSFTNDDADENPYNFAISGTASGAPEIAVSEATGGAIADGGTLAQGTKAAGTAQTLTFTVSNSGTDTLTLATATSANASNVSVGSISAPGSTSVAAGGSTTFTVQYTPTAAGAFSFDLSFTNDDADENPYNFAISGTASATATPATEFQSAELEVETVLTDSAQRALRSLVQGNRDMLRGSRARMLARDGGRSGDGSSLRVDASSKSATGMFDNVTPLAYDSRRIISADVLMRSDTGSGTRATTLDTRVIWERDTDMDTTLGFFLGAEVAQTGLTGNFEGTLNRQGGTLGGYLLRRLSDQLFLDAYASAGMARNALEMSDGVLDLTSDYTTTTTAIGGALTGVIRQERFTLKPELAFNYAETRIGTVGFTGAAYALVDDTLSLNAGRVAFADLTLRPEVTLPLSAEGWAAGAPQISFAPRLLCQRTQSDTVTQSCGSGFDVTFSTGQVTGKGATRLRVQSDFLGAGTQTSVGFEYRREF